MSILRKGCVALSNLRVKGPPVSVPVTAAVLILSLNPACCLQCALVVVRVSVALLVGGGGGVSLRPRRVPPCWFVMLLLA